MRFPHFSICDVAFNEPYLLLQLSLSKLNKLHQIHRYSLCSRQPCNPDFLHNMYKMLFPYSIAKLPWYSVPGRNVYCIWTVYMYIPCNQGNLPLTMHLPTYSQSIHRTTSLVICMLCGLPCRRRDRTIFLL